MWRLLLSAGGLLSAALVPVSARVPAAIATDENILRSEILRSAVYLP
jgi:hypothetical protein